MLGLFKSKPLLSEQDRQFQIETWRWLLEHFADTFYGAAQLVLPTKAFFPMQLESDDDAALKTFEQVKQLACLDNWPCRLEKQERDTDVKIAPTLVVQNVPQGPAGTFSVTPQEEVVISYNPNVVANPVQMVATFAHELAHYLTATCSSAPPGGWDNWEFATDISAIFMGFGVFQANAAFNFTQYASVDAQGWQFNRSGYLTEAEHIYSLAIFLELKEIEQNKALPHLKPGLRKLLKMAVKELRKGDVLAGLKQLG